MHNWLIDGVAGDRIAVDDRGFTYADGLFETIAVRDGQLRFFDYHLDRLLNGARQLNIPAPERELFADEAGDLVKESEYATLKIILTRGTGHRGYAPPVTATSSRLLGLLPGVPPARTKYIDGIVVRHCSTSIGHSPATAGLKTLGRLEQVLASLHPPFQRASYFHRSKQLQQEAFQIGRSFSIHHPHVRKSLPHALR